MVEFLTPVPLIQRELGDPVTGPAGDQSVRVTIPTGQVKDQTGETDDTPSYLSSVPPNIHEYFTQMSVRGQKW